MRDLIIDFIIAFLISVGVIALVGAINIGERNTYQYEYETSDGDSGAAVSCGVPYRGVPYCILEDGTRVYGLKQYKKVLKSKDI